MLYISICAYQMSTNVSPNAPSSLDVKSRKVTYQWSVSCSSHQKPALHPASQTLYERLGADTVWFRPEVCEWSSDRDSSKWSTPCASVRWEPSGLCWGFTGEEERGRTSRIYDITASLDTNYGPLCNLQTVCVSMCPFFNNEWGIWQFHF